MYCAVAPTLKWSTFPLTGLFPALVLRSVSYLRSREQLSHSFVAGEQVQVLLPKRYGEGSYTFVDPQLVESQIQAISLPAGNVVSLGTLIETGVYSIKSRNGEDLEMIDVNAPSTESIPVFLSDSELNAQLEVEIKNQNGIEILDPSKNLNESVARARIGTELWKLFIILALIFAGAEMIIAGRISRRTAE
jgi:hypothetical protein